MPSLAASLTAVAAVAALALSAPTARAANCTSAEATTVAALDKVLEDNAECARLNSLVPGEATTLQICSDAACVRIVKKAASSVPDCLIDGESAQRIALVAFKSCSVSEETPTTAPTPTSAPESTTKAPSAAGGSIAGESDVKSAAPTTSAPAPTPKSAAATATATVSTVVVASAASLLLSAWF